MVPFRVGVVPVLLLAIPLTLLAGEGVWTSNGPAADISAIAVDTQARVVVAAGRGIGAAVDSVFTRSSSEVDWTERAQASIGVTIFSLAIDASNPTTIYAGGSVEGTPPDGAIYVSGDSGLSWSFLHLFSKSPVYTVAVDPTDSNKIYVGGSICTGGLACSSFVSRSVDSGNSWTSTPTFAWAHSVVALAIDPNETSHLYAATDYGLLYSGDSAATWSGQFGTPERSQEQTEITCISMSPANPGTIYVGWHTPPCGFFQKDCNGPFGEGGAAMTRNGGGSWTFLSPPIQVDALVISPANPRVIYAGGSGGVFKSTDGGLTWSRLGDLPGAAVIQLNPLTNVIYAASSGVSEYEDTPLSQPRLVPRIRSVRDLSSRD